MTVTSHGTWGVTEGNRRNRPEVPHEKYWSVPIPPGKHDVRVMHLTSMHGRSIHGSLVVGWDLPKVGTYYLGTPWVPLCTHIWEVCTYIWKVGR